MEMKAQAKAPIQIALIDDQLIVREAVGALLEGGGSAVVVGSFRHGEGVIEALKESQAQAVLIGFDAQLSNPVITVSQIARALPQLPQCALVGSGQQDIVHSAIAAGCVGVVSSSAARETVVAALDALIGGQSYVDPGLGGSLLIREFRARQQRSQHNAKGG
jgi:DNA-binding NarL/FixJ family response regulator